MIPGDAEGRCWIEVSGVNPKEVESLRPSLVAFAGFDRDYRPQLAGSGFVIAGDDEKALVMSAKHVLTEGITRIQRPHPGFAPSALFVGSFHSTPSLDARKLRAVWMNSTSAAMLPAIYACYNDVLDMALCLLTPQRGESLAGLVSVPLHLHVPAVGDFVHMVSLDGLSAKESMPSVEALGDTQPITVSRRVSIRVGVVTALYLDGYRQFRWPCFTTSIPAAPGMSGGFVSVPKEQTTIAACGVVCADCSTPEAHTDYGVCGESVIACSWPALALRLPGLLPHPKGAPTFSMLEMMKRGNIPPAIGGIGRVTIEEIGDDQYTIRLAA